MKRAVCLLLASLILLGLMPTNSAAQENRRADRPESETATGDSEPTNQLGNPEGMVDQLIFFDSPQAWDRGEMRGVAVSTHGKPRLELVFEGDRTFGRSGRWVSPETKTDFQFTEIIPSWNADVPEDTGVIFHIRTHDAATSEWSPWLYTGQWGRTVMNPAQEISFDGGSIRIDVLRLKNPADAFQLRTTLQCYRFDNAQKPAIRRIAVVYSGIVADPVERAKVSRQPNVPKQWARNISVPFFAQRDNPGGTGGSTCSPTSLSMVATYWGAANPVAENCAAIYDPNYGMFGNWARATQRAGELGLDAWVTRVRTWDQVKEYIGDGQPLIASIRFRDGEFPSNVLERTNGHLIVVRGLTAEGDVIVNDPASKEKGEAVVYKADELARAWFDRGGVAYVVRKDDLKRAGNGE